jgi:hypothetical protein
MNQNRENAGLLVLHLLFIVHICQVILDQKHQDHAPILFDI